MAASARSGALEASSSFQPFALQLNLIVMAAALFNGLFGGAKPSASPIPDGDSDFADFPGAPDPSPASFSAIPSGPSFDGFAASTTGVVRPYTKWYNVHERYSPSDFKQEGVIFIVILVVLAVHLWGTRANRARAKAWISTFSPALEQEFALVGFGGRKAPTAESVEAEGLLQSTADDSLNDPVELLKEKSLSEYASYATGRQNVAFVDLGITLTKRYSPLTVFAETAIGFFIESMAASSECMTVTMYPFDGKEALTVPGQIPGAQELRSKDSKSSYDGFVWAIVNKESMKVLRDERYDVSLTTTKDHPKLPVWATVMTESSEVTDLLLTPELINAVKEAGELMDHIIITDQPIDKPLTINDTIPKKRLYFSARLPSSTSEYAKTLPLFEYFLRLPDMLVQSAHFRPEVMRKVRTTREDMVRKLQKADEDEKADERALEREKAKKMKRDTELKGLDAKAQKKYLEKEKEKEMKKMQKKQSTRA